MATLTILGTASAAPPAGGACSAYLVSTPSANVLLDIGPGSLPQLRAAVDVHDLDAIVISHMHTDHFLDLLALNVARLTQPGMRMAGGAPWRLPVYLPPGGRATVEACFAALQVNVSGTMSARYGEHLELIEYDPAATLRVADLAISFVGPTKHSQLDYGIRVATSRGSILGYTGDTAYCDAAIEVGRRADLFLAESTLAEPGPASETHTCAAELAAMAEAARPGQLVATHFLSHDEAYLGAIEERLRDVSMPRTLARIGATFDF
jgi:ribonuclease BN (tRNA processing enzyme)